MTRGTTIVAPGRIRALGYAVCLMLAGSACRYGYDEEGSDPVGGGGGFGGGAGTAGAAGMDAGLDAASGSDGGHHDMDGSEPPDDAALEAGTDAGDPLDAGTSPTTANLAAGLNHSCLVADGALYCWGRNSHGKLGLGFDGLTADQPSPVRVRTTVDLSSEPAWLQVCTGEDHSCAVTTGGELYCWGDNLQSQLGTGDLDPRDRPTRVGTAITWSQVSCLGTSTCGLQADGLGAGQLFCWGDNLEAGAGGFTTMDFPTPTPIGDSALRFIRVSTGQAHGCALSTAAELYCWGRNLGGQLGRGVTNQWSGELMPVEPAPWKAFGTGQKLTCGIPEATEALWCWGGAGLPEDVSLNGEVGIGQAQGRVEVAAIDPGSTIRWRSVAGSVRPHTCAITTASALYCWGNGEDGQLGYGPIVVDATSGLSRYSPTPVAGRNDDWQQVSPGGAHTCGLRADNSLWCWGKDEYGQLGNGAEVGTSVAEPECIAIPDVTSCPTL